MFCKNCGTQLKEGAKFCGNCGTAVAAAGQPAAPVTPAAPPWQSQQYASVPPAGKKLSLFRIFLIVIPIQYICCFTFVAFNCDGITMALFEDYYYSRGTSPLPAEIILVDIGPNIPPPPPPGSRFWQNSPSPSYSPSPPYMHWWDIPMSQRALFNITLFLVIHGPSSVLLFFIIKHCLKRRKKAAFGFSIPLALWYIALIGFSLLGFDIGRSSFYSSHNIFYTLYDYSLYDYSLSLFPLLVVGLLTFYPLIPPLLTLIRFEGSHSQPTSAKMPPPITG
ncbi:MAG: zinc ribbon domain-containing protein [Spirochaetaceae bacterium]|jgi:hypothetical protein|nr:zinc ribbon domain-containing protein [Spirochaetaceae bacterium]